MGHSEPRNNRSDAVMKAVNDRKAEHKLGFTQKISTEDPADLLLCIDLLLRVKEQRGAEKQELLREESRGERTCLCPLCTIIPAFNSMRFCLMHQRLHDVSR